MRRVWRGQPFPLGATWDGDGTNFSLYAAEAEAVELCLFDETGAEERIRVSECSLHNWHCYLPGVGPGQLYGYRVFGRYSPQDGQRFNGAKLLIDPYAKAIDGGVDWSAANVLPYVPDAENPDADLEADDEDSAPAMPRCVVIDEQFDWGDDDRRPQHDWSRTVIYELHVKGFTKLNERIREDLRGTYAGLASDAAIEYLRELGITAVELLPVHHFIGESFLVDRGLTNYWGYSSIGYFAPHSAYAATGERGQQLDEFKGMVKALHAAGIEVILDVVYNHTAEGNHLGPMLGFKGIGNRAYYRLMPDDARHYLDFTGTGNSLDPTSPAVLRLIMDSLRYWVTHCHVDGFRFDLAPVLVRGVAAERPSAFFEIIQQDPILSKVKLIAEPWDASPDGFQLGRFPPGWAEWNGAFRDCVRRFWRGDPGQVPELASRLTGSSDIFAPTGRKTYASINFVSCHDGFTLNDLVSYEHKHNEANGESNQDGTNDNNSRNWGAEGPTESVRILRARERMKRNLLATVFFSQGVPMLLGGDEVGRTQEGNNNAYCQDNEISWFDWDVSEADHELRKFVRDVIVISKNNPILRRRNFFTGQPVAGYETKDVSWVRADGQEMTDDDWANPSIQSVGMLLFGPAADELDSRGRSSVAESVLFLLNASTKSFTFTLPSMELPGVWEEVLNTARPGPWARLVRTDAVNLSAHSTVLLRHTERPQQ